MLTNYQKLLLLQTNYYYGRCISDIGGRFEDVNSVQYEMLEDWISQTLGVNFREDIYNNDAYLDACRIYQSDLKALGITNWFIGDELTGIIMKYLNESIEEQPDLDYFIAKIDNELKHKFNTFLKVIGTSNQEESVEVCTSDNHSLQKTLDLILSRLEALEKKTEERL